jgi:hypothetical protein
MSGGTIIIHAKIREILTNPLVSGQLPGPMKVIVDLVMDKEDGDWDQHDKQAVAEAVEWALLNCR